MFSNNNYYLKRAGIFMMLAGVVTLTSCNDDDDGDDLNPDPNPQPEYAAVDVGDQIVSQNSIRLSSVDLPEDGWVVINRDNGNNGPDVPGIISIPKYVDDGHSENVVVRFESDEGMTDGETIWVRLHRDNSEPNEFEYDENQDFDTPFTNANDNVVMQSIVLTSPDIIVTDQPVLGDSQNKTIVIDQVRSGVSGIVAVYGTNILGILDESVLLGSATVEEGTPQNITVSIDPTINYNSGDQLAVRLHNDTGSMGEFEYVNSDSAEDIPEVFESGEFLENTTIVETFEVQ